MNPVYVIAFGPLQSYFAGLNESQIILSFSKERAINYGDKAYALQMEERLNAMFRCEGLEFQVLEVEQ